MISPHPNLLPQGEGIALKRRAKFISRSHVPRGLNRPLGEELKIGQRRALLRFFLDNRVGQHLRHVFGMNRREMFDLMPATRAGSDHGCPAGCASIFSTSGSATLSESSYFDSSAPKAPAIPQQPVSSNVAFRPGKRSARRAMKSGLSRATSRGNARESRRPLVDR